MKIIVEVANTHEGDIGYLYKHIESLNEVGVDAIKFQYLIPEEFGDAGSENFVEFTRLRIPHEDFENLVGKYSNIAFYFDVFGNESLTRVIEIAKVNSNLKGIKLHATSSMNFDLILKSSNEVDELFVSISGLTAVEISELVKFATNNDIKNKMILTYGVQNSPTLIEEIKINKLVELKKIFGMKICLSEHLDGAINMAKTIVSLANILGFDYIEKHSTLDRDRKLDDDTSALNVAEIAEVIKEQSCVKSLISDNVLTLSPKELEYRNKVKLAIYANKDIAAGEKFILNDSSLLLKRQEHAEGSNINYLNLYDIIGRAASQKIKNGSLITSEMVEQKVLWVVLIRSASSRLPNKAYAKIGEYLCVDFLIKRLKTSKRNEQMVICTTDLSEDDVIEKIARENSVDCVRGSENISERLEKVFASYECDVFVRLTGDNVFVDTDHIDQVLLEFVNGKYDYYRHENVIDGCDFEVVNKRAYDSLGCYFGNFFENSEYMTLFLKNSYFREMNSKAYDINFDFAAYRFTLDYIEDLNNIRLIFDAFKRIDFSYQELCELIASGKSGFIPFQPPNKALGVQVSKKTLF